MALNRMAAANLLSTMLPIAKYSHYLAAVPKDNPPPVVLEPSIPDPKLKPDILPTITYNLFRLHLRMQTIGTTANRLVSNHLRRTREGQIPHFLGETLLFT